MFRVEWMQSAVAEMQRLWGLADPALREQIRLAILEVDRRLQLDPLGEGESREEGLRITFVPPLGLTFQVEEAAQVASVVHVWTFRTHG